ncbi:Chorion peroxidase [Nymphon striatum]|nr:Chorion peroxidase [Nymphon striatum]
MVEELRTASNKVSSEINLSKTKVMFNRNVEIQRIMTGNVALDQVDRYTYLGQLISMHRDWEPELRRRVALGWQAFGRLKQCLVQQATSLLEAEGIRQMCPACPNVWVRDLGNYRYPVEKIAECPTQYGEKDLLSWRDRKTNSWVNSVPDNSVPLPPQFGIGQFDAGQFGAGQFGAGKFGAGQFGAVQFGAGQFGAGKFGAGQFGAGQFGAGQFGAGKFGAGQFGAGQFGAGQFGAGKFGAGQFGAGQFGAGQFGDGQFGAGQFGADQFGAGQFGAGQFGSAATPIRELVLLVLVLHCCVSDLDGFQLTKKDIIYGKKYASAKEKQLLSIENVILGVDLKPEPNSPEERLQNMAGTSNQIQEDEKNADYIINFMIGVCKRKKCNWRDLVEFRNMKIPNELNAKCPKPITCDEVTREYRTIDGTCNNLKRPLEGSSDTAQGRLLRPAYEDELLMIHIDVDSLDVASIDIQSVVATVFELLNNIWISVPRKSSKLGGRLNSPRYISKTIMTDIQNLSKSKTSLLTFFGQMISHDYSITPMIRAKGEEFLCCKGSRKGTRQHPGCFTIPIPKKDNFYSKYKKKCMEFIRSTAVLKSSCRFGFREQQNAITTYMDGSFIYGSNDETADQLRLKSSGLLKSTDADLMPQKVGHNSCTAQAKNCEFLGDKHSLEDYLEYFDSIKKANEWDEERAACMLVPSLGIGSRLLDDVTDSVRAKYSSLRIALLAAGAPHRLARVGELKICKLKLGETAQQFRSRVSQLVEQCYSGFAIANRRELVLDNFIYGLPMEMRTAVMLQKPKKIDEAITAAMMYESMSHLPRPRDSNFQNKNVSFQHNNKKTTRDKRIVCFKCNLEGHYANKCTNRTPSFNEKKTGGLQCDYQSGTLDKNNTDGSSRLFVPVIVDGIKQGMLCDSGATVSLLPDSLFIASKGSNREAIISVSGHNIPCMGTKECTLVCGNKKIKHIFRIAPVDHGYLGADLLERMKVRIDFNIKKMVFDDGGTVLMVNENYSDNKQQFGGVKDNPDIDFESKTFKEFLTKFGIRHLRTSAYHPQSDLVERVNRTLLNMVRAYIKDEKASWDKHLQKLSFAYITSHHETIGTSPFEMLRGERAQLPVDVFYSELKANEVLHRSDVFKKISEVRQNARILAVKCAKNREKYYNRAKHVKKPPEFQKEDLVLWKKPTIQPGVSPKLQPRWTGPFLIEKKLSDLIYRIKGETGGTAVVHVNNLKKSFGKKPVNMIRKRGRPRDVRANENIGLTTMHTIFMREHNRIASFISKMRRSWDDEKIYQETRTTISGSNIPENLKSLTISVLTLLTLINVTMGLVAPPLSSRGTTEKPRKIVIAFMQNMVMTEYLPIVLGKNLLNKYDLGLSKTNLDPNIYDPNINVEVSNAFSTAAFRFAHSMVNDDIEFAYADGEIESSPFEMKLFNTSDIYDPKRLNAIANGMLHQHPRVCSVHMASSMSKRLFLKEGEKSGLDLGSLNIQRGRDHGLPGYNEYRKHCNLKKYRSISKMPITKKMKRKLRKVYKHVDDIDLFVGGLLEPHIGGAEVGETFGCIIGEQFRRLVKGDRFFYANGKRAPKSARQAKSIDTSKVGHGFTQVQYKQFRKASLAQIICDNIDIKKIQPHAMLAEGKGKFTILLLALFCFHELDGFELTEDYIAAGIKYASSAQEERESIEKELLEVVPVHDSPEDREQLLAGTSERIRKDEKNAEFILNFMKGVCLEKQCSAEDLSEFSKLSIPDNLNGNCVKRISCDATSQKYRTINGTCNNLKRPIEGSSNTAQGRLLDPFYDDGITAPRRHSKLGGLLHSPRHISNIVMTDEQHLTTSKTSLLTYFGQIISHDYSITPMITANGREFLCCKEALNGSRVHPGCQTIGIAEDDAFYSHFSKKCMEFIRSTAVLRNDCTFGWREQVNAITTYMDGSFIYGSTNDVADNLRTKTDGDARANENVGLTAIHTVFMREHNRIAKVMKDSKQEWDDEKIFQETRKIVIAFMQTMVMKEYLPATLGKSILKNIRFAHTMINNEIEFVYENREINSSHFEGKLFHPEDIYFSKRLTAIINGMLHQHPRICSVYMASSISKKLFMKDGEECGLDLGSLNIQRGRDHGLPPYNEYRKFCKLEPYDSIANMPLSEDLKEKLSKVYEHVDDIDIYVGGILEPVHEGEVGETFGCIIGEQFRVLVKGDRFFLANGQKADILSSDEGIPADNSRIGHAYTEAQYKEFQKASLAQIVCDNTNVIEIQPEVLKSVGNGNEITNCDAIVRPDLNVIFEDLEPAGV